jgi:hypothetical protein
LKTFPGRVCRTADPSASLGMTKGKAMLPCASGGWWRAQQVPPLRYAPVGMTIHIWVRDAIAQQNWPAD